MLNWETILDTTPNTNVQTTHMAEEPNNKLYQYIKEDVSTWDRFTEIELGDYSSPLWGEKEQNLTNKKIRRLGIKHFPQTGAIAFWSLLYEQKSQILAPVHHEPQRYSKPNFRIEETSDTLIFHISSPDTIEIPSDLVGVIGSDVKYLCYRIVLRLDAFALEYVTYEETLEVPKPSTTGTYDIYCVGYIHEGEAVSEDSDHYELFIQGTRDTWPGPDISADICITDIAITDDNKIRVTRSDGQQITSEKAVNAADIYPISASFSSDGYLLINLSNGSSITTENPIPTDSYVKQIQELENTLNDVSSLVDEINGVEV